MTRHILDSVDMTVVGTVDPYASWLASDGRAPLPSRMKNN